MLKRSDTYLLKTFGGLHLVGSDGSPVELSRRRLALLALLAVAGERGVPRERLVAYLWPDSPTEAGRHSLEQMLSALRGRLGTAVFVGTDPVRLDERIVQCDLAALRGAPAEIGGVEPPDGPFLDGFYLEGLKDFEEWVERERARLHERRLDSVAALARRATEPAEAVRLWRRYVHLDPLRTEGALGLMRALATAGDRVGAVRHAELHERLLRTELDLPPDAAVAALSGELQTRQAPGTGLKPLRPVTREHPTRGGWLPPASEDPTDAPQTTPRPRSRVLASPIPYGKLVALVAVIGMVTVLAWPPTGGGNGRSDLSSVQVTFSGDVHWPSLSPDKGRVAYWACDTGAVSAERAILHVRDLGGAGEVRLATFQWMGPTAWTKDGRHVLVFGLPLPGTGGAPRTGMYAVPLLGGAPGYLGCCLGTRMPGTDTLVLLPSEGAAGSRYLRFVTIADGILRDSIQIPDWPLGGGFTAVFASPDGKRLAVAARDVAGLMLRIVARTGEAGSALRLEAPVRDPPGLLGWAPDGRGLLIMRLAAGPTGGSDILHLPVSGIQVIGDPKLLAPAVPARFGESLGEDGSFVFAGGTIEHRVWALVAEGGTDDLRFRAVLMDRSTGIVLGRPSPDGTRILLTRRSASGFRTELGLARPGERPAYPLGPGIDRQLQFDWTWDGEAAWVMRASGESGTIIDRIDLETGERARRFTIGGLRLRAAADLAGGQMLALSNDGTRLHLLGPGREEIRPIKLPVGASRVNSIGPSPDGVRVPVIVEGGDLAATSVTRVMALVTNLRDRSWHRYPVEGPRFDEPPSLATDGSMLVSAERPPGPTVWVESGPRGQSRQLREVPLPRAEFRFSVDRRLAVANQVAHQADAFVVPEFASLLGR